MTPKSSMNTKIKPFQGRRIFLHLKHVIPARRKQLKTDLERLGAEVEEFFSNQVHCVVSDHATTPIGKCGEVEATLITNLPSPAHKHIASQQCKNQVPKTPENMSMSRGQCLLQIAKSKENQNSIIRSPTDSVLDACKRFHIAVVHLRQISAFLQKKALFSPSGSSKSHASHSSSKENDSHKGSHHSKRQRFTEHFLKIEDVNQLYRPAFVTFSKWPDFMRLDRGSDPGAKQFAGGFAPLKPREKEVTVAKVESSKQSKSASSNKQKQPPHPERRLCCEICGIIYVSLTEHTQSSKHTRFVENEVNYALLRRMIGTLKKPESFIGELTPRQETPFSAHNIKKPLPIRNFGDFLSPVVRIHPAPEDLPGTRTPNKPVPGVLSERQQSSCNGSEAGKAPVFRRDSSVFVATLSDVRRVRVALPSPAKAHLLPGNEALKRRLQLTAERKLRSDGDTILHEGGSEATPSKQRRTPVSWIESTPKRQFVLGTGSQFSASPLTSGSRVPGSCDTPEVKLLQTPPPTPTSFSCNDIDLGGPFYELPPPFNFSLHQEENTNVNVANDQCYVDNGQRYVDNDQCYVDDQCQPASPYDATATVNGAEPLFTPPSNSYDANAEVSLKGDINWWFEDPQVVTDNDSTFPDVDCSAANDENAYPKVLYIGDDAENVDCGLDSSKTTKNQSQGNQGGHDKPMGCEDHTSRSRRSSAGKEYSRSSLNSDSPLNRIDEDPQVLSVGYADNLDCGLDSSKTTKNQSQGNQRGHDKPMGCKDHGSRSRRSSADKQYSRSSMNRDIPLNRIADTGFPHSNHHERRVSDGDHGLSNNAHKADDSINDDVKTQNGNQTNVLAEGISTCASPKDELCKTERKSPREQCARGKEAVVNTVNDDDCDSADCCDRVRHRSKRDDAYDINGSSIILEVLDEA